MDPAQPKGTAPRVMHEQLCDEICDRWAKDETPRAARHRVAFEVFRDNRDALTPTDRIALYAYCYLAVETDGWPMEYPVSDETAATVESGRLNATLDNERLFGDDSDTVAFLGLLYTAASLASLTETFVSALGD